MVAKKVYNMNDLQIDSNNASDKGFVWPLERWCYPYHLEAMNMA